MADDIHRLSDELARDPSSLAFLELGEALRLQGDLEIAIKIGLRGVERHPMHGEAHALLARIAVDQRDFTRAAEAWETVLRIVPEHPAALKGLGYVALQQGRFEEAERFLARANTLGAKAAPGSALDPSLVLPPGLARAHAIDAVIPSDPQRLFADLLVDDGQTALLLDASGYVLGGLYLDGEGGDRSQEIGAQLSGISDEVIRSVRHLDIGEWRSILFETQVAVVALAPAADNGLLVVVASRATPLGLLRRLLERCVRRSAAWLRRGGEEPGLGQRGTGQ
jgi:tetratricopeptide (TPR) repeat protein